jgi:hypothetical protein
MYGANSYGVKPFGMVSSISDHARTSIVIVSAAAATALSAFKVGRSKTDCVVTLSYDTNAIKLGIKTIAIDAGAFDGLASSKQGLGIVSTPASTSITTAARKQGVTKFSVPFTVDIYMGTGSVAVNATFTVTGTAAVNFLSSKAASSSLSVQSTAETTVQAIKVAQGSTATVASASSSIAGLKISAGSAAVAASASFEVSWYKSGSSRPEVLASVTISLIGGNPSVVIPVSMAYITTTSRYAQAITTASRFEYQLTTSSGGSIV